MTQQGEHHMICSRKVAVGLTLSLVGTLAGAAPAQADTQSGWFCRYSSPLTAASTVKEPISLDLTDTGTNEAVKASAKGQGHQFQLNDAEIAAFYSLFDQPTLDQCAALLTDIRGGKVQNPAGNDKLRPKSPTPATTEAQPTDSSNPAGASQPAKTSSANESAADRPTRGVAARTGDDSVDLAVPLGLVTALAAVAAGTLARGRRAR